MAHGKPPKLTKEQYQLVLAAFREHPGREFKRAANAAGLRDPRCAKRAWEVGWREFPDERARPIRDVLAQEEEEAAKLAQREEVRRREAAQRAAQEGDEAVRREAAERRAAMLQLAKGVRGTLAAGLASLQHAGRAIVAVMQTFGEDSIAELRAMPAKEKLKVARDYTLAVERVTLSYEAVDRIARLDDERPTEILGVEVSMEEAAREIEAAHRTLALAREEGLLGEEEDAEVVAEPAPASASARPN